MIHGDLKGVRDRPQSRFTIIPTPTQPDIIVDDSGNARIAGFVLATVVKDADPVKSGSCQHDHARRWNAPEIVNGEGTCSKEADIFSFAMVMIEECYGRSATCRTLAYHRFVSIQVFTGAVPFNSGLSTMAILAIAEGSQPTRPTHPTLTESLWALMQRCWDRNPHLRPEVSGVLQALAESVSCSFGESYIC